MGKAWRVAYTLWVGVVRLLGWRIRGAVLRGKVWCEGGEELGAHARSTPTIPLPGPPHDKNEVTKTKPSTALRYHVKQNNPYHNQCLHAQTKQVVPEHTLNDTHHVRWPRTFCLEPGQRTASSRSLGGVEGWV